MINIHGASTPCRQVQAQHSYPRSFWIEFERIMPISGLSQTMQKQLHATLMHERTFNSYPNRSKDSVEIRKSLALLITSLPSDRSPRE
jgi:hypothetical protein